MQLAIFVFIGALGAALHRSLGWWRASIVTVPLTTAVVYLHARGYWLMNEYLHQQMRTAAALNLGFAIMKAGALVLVACLARDWIAKALSRLP
jgi:hypothetical protein